MEKCNIKFERTIEMTKRLTSTIFAILLCISTVLTLCVSAAPSTSYSTEKNYRDAYKNVVDGASTVNVKHETQLLFFYKHTTITPNPTGAPDKAIALDHYSLDSSINVSLGSLKYISIYCKYNGSKTLEKPILMLTSNNGQQLTSQVTVRAIEDIPKGSFGWVNFEVGSVAYGKVTSESLLQFHLLPYGNAASGTLTTSDTINIQKIKFRSNDKAAEVTSVSYPVRFTGAREDVTGTDPATTYVKVGGTFTLPENPYKRENHTFNGWLCSANNQVYKPGDVYTVTERKRNGSALLNDTTGEVLFYPDWEIVDGSIDYPDNYSVYYSNYYNAMLGNQDYFESPVNDYEFDGKKTVKLKIKTSSSDAILLDGWLWEGMPFDLDKYNYATITYYLDTKKSFSATPSMVAQPGNKLPTPITSAVTVISETKLETGKWAVMGFDLSAIKAKRNPDITQHYLRQFHLYLTGHSNANSNRIKASDFNDGDALYMHSLTLHTKKPSNLQNPETSLDYDTAVAEEYIKELDIYEAERIEEIRNTPSVYKTNSYGSVYYVSSSSGSASGGSSSSSPRLISNLSEISNISLKNGDTVLFKRGDVFRGTMTAVAGVTYSAYGSGDKPKLYRSEKDLAGASNWTVHYEDATGKKIWKTASTVTNDVGAIVLNEGEEIGLKEIPSYTNEKYWVRGQENSVEFDIVKELDNNLEFFHDLGGAVSGQGTVYFRCDSGNPGSVYYSIEMNQRGNLISGASNVTIDNLCLMYFGSHGIGAGTVSNLTVTNCEIGYGGGSVQFYNDNGKVTRFGNGIEIYGGLVNFTIDNCYVYEIYDAGVTHQISTTSHGNYYMKNVVYSNNVLCDSTYNIEYFMSKDESSETSERFMENVLFENNLIRRAGYGWGQQRLDDVPAGIKGWPHNNYGANTVLRNNIIDRCYNHTGGTSHLIELGTKYNGSTAYLDGNTFVQVPERYFALSQKTAYKYDVALEEYIDIIGGENNKIYYAPEDYGKVVKYQKPPEGIDYSKVQQGIADRINTATVTTSAFDSTTVITPNPTGTPDKAIILDHYGLSVSLPDLKYISIYCKYDGTKGLPKPTVRLMGHSGKYLTENVTVVANESISKKGYAWINFDVGCVAYGKVAGDTLFQFHFNPYGDTLSGNLDASDVISIQKIRFVSNSGIAESGITGIYPVSFTAGRADVTGEDPETVYVKVGSSMTLPENPYKRENHTFSGWVCSVDSKLYQPGANYTVTERQRAESALLKNVTGEALFFPEWKVSKAPSNSLPNVLSVPYTNYYCNMLGENDAAKDYFKATKNYNFNGRNTIRLEILPASSNALIADGWDWNIIPFDLDKYKYCTITYYVDTDKTFDSVYPAFVALANGGALTKNVNIRSEYPFTTGKWAIMGFDLTNLESVFNSSLDQHILKQFHLYITGHNNSDANRIKPSDFNEGDAIYLDALTLYTEKPEGDFRIQQSIMSGDGSGNIRPHDTLTRAEAAVVILNVLGNEGRITQMPSDIHMKFTDVSETDWFYYAVMAMDSLGYVPEDGLFRPNDPITVAEFMRFMFFIEKDGMHIPSFENNEGSQRLITRAQAAMIISDWHTNGVPKQLLNILPRVKVFEDLNGNSAEYYAFMNIGAARLSSFDENGEETVYQLLCAGSTPDSLEYDFSETSDYIRELDKLEAKRIAEIRNTESVYKTKHKDNKIYYVSSTEGTADGGLSADNPRLVTKLADVSKLAVVNGDVVLFKRGDVFRGTLSTVAGVTYSAYGEGEKPKLYRSEKNHTGAENWVVHYQDSETGKTIWKTAYKVSQDVGAIIVNDGEIVGLKEIPSYVSGAYYVRGKEPTKSDGSVNEAAKQFVIIDELDNNHEFFHDLGGTNTTASGYIYFRCDEGNPGELFESIEMNQKTNLIGAKSNVTIDNLCLKYFGSHGIGTGTVSNLTITNCEIGWGGGSIQHYNNNGRGTVTRFGNGIEIYGGLVNYRIDNCYVYQIYDAGITHQISKTSHGNYYMKNVVYSNNVLCDSTYNIEYFMSVDESNTNSERFMENVLFENNLIRRAGYGWGQQRPDDAPAGIKGWSHHNNAVNTIVRNNIIDRCYNHTGGQSHLIQMGTTYNAAGPYLEGNTFVQVPGRHFAMTHKTDYRYGHTTESDISNYIGGKDNTIYFAVEDYGN